ncbi:hypothetical protein BKA67DRAFT_662064 [Truncatella angustata]|uniref:Uncharacterized protein n=1 Tax=Truncatella angustata TaxID=152316 RepID=A0A9P8ZUN0_9PEZI|nr:uncharacterized protein BKA67DRAFT_662064 [Truncatella angustata]KAH6649147.1 hypothetical protein BKA67DRAFT_662064 [Truncatella angustata]
MCKYYAHAFSCKHSSLTFARFCNPASFTQTPCGQQTIWHTIGLEEACEECQVWFPDKYCSGGPVAAAPPPVIAPVVAQHHHHSSRRVVGGVKPNRRRSRS